ncbi:MAG: RNA 2',3'-cyclic phosphodiesterase [Woeseia sp.]
MPDRRLFFALWLSDRQRELLRDTLRPVLTSVEGAVVDRRDWHVTLVFIGAFPDEQIPFLQAAAGEIEPEPIRLRFDRLDFWQRAKVATLMPRAVPPALEALVRSLEKTLEAFDVKAEDRLYRPHITVARRARNFETVPLTRPVDLEWQDFDLMESVSGPSGARYRPLKQ